MVFFRQNYKNLDDKKNKNYVFYTYKLLKKSVFLIIFKNPKTLLVIHSLYTRVDFIIGTRHSSISRSIKELTKYFSISISIETKSHSNVHN